MVLKSFMGMGQSISPATQNIGGTLGQQSNYTLTFSVGEMVSTTNFVGPDKTSLSSGFLQSFSPLVTGIENLPLLAPGIIEIMPNPVKDVMVIQAKVETPGQLTFNIIDGISSSHFTSPTYNVGYDFSTKINVANWVSGIYYVRVLFKPNIGMPKWGIYKIIKL